MFLFQGQKPLPLILLNAFKGSCLSIGALLAFVLITSHGVAAQNDPLSLAEAESLALQSEPGRASLLAGAEAYQELSIAAGQLPDPKLRTGLANYPLESGNFSTEGMTQIQLGIRQAFPAGNTRAINTQQFQSRALEMHEKAEGRQREVLSAVRNIWLETYYWTRAQQLVNDSRVYFTDLVTISTDLYAVGMKDQQDVLRSELELSRLDDRLINIDKQILRSQAQLSQWIGTQATRPPAASLPDWSKLPSPDSLHTNLLIHPSVKASHARIDVQSSSIDLAKENYKPGWAIDAGYAYRDGRLPNGGSRSDFISVGVTVDLPLFKRNRQDRKLAAAVSQRRAATESHEQLLRGLSSQLDAEVARWESLTRRLDLYESQIIIQTKEQADAALLAYQNNTGDFAEVMRGYIANLNAQLDYDRLQVERAQSYALLANLGGISQ